MKLLKDLFPSIHVECLKGPLYLTESQPTTDSYFLLHSNNFCFALRARRAPPAPSPLGRVAAQMSQPITLTPPQKKFPISAPEHRYVLVCAQPFTNHAQHCMVHASLFRACSLTACWLIVVGQD